MDANAIIPAINALKPGEKMVYYSSAETGEQFTTLAQSLKGQEARQVQDILHKQYEAGYVTMYQRKTGGVFDYIVERLR